MKVTKGDLSEFLNSILSSFNQLAREKRIRYTIIQHPEPAETWFDHEKLENIIYNLVSNAFKYTPENGAITVDFGVLASEVPTDHKKGTKTLTN